MSFDFPNAPSEGTTFAPTGGPVYVYTGGVWRMQGSGQVVTAEARNRIVNGAMQISQENPKNVGLTVNGSYPADQWQVNFITTGAINFICYDAASGAVSAEDEAVSMIRINAGVADTSLTTSESLRLLTIIEASRIADFKWGSAQAKPAVLRLRARSGIPGTFAINLREFASTCNFIKHCTFTAANVWQTFVVPVPACTIGTWNTGTSGALVLQIWAANGATTYGIDNAWNAGAPLLAGPITNWLSAVGQNFEITNVGLYLDPNATGVPPPWQMPDEAQELAACQRYFCKADIDQTYHGLVASVTQWYEAVRFPVPMRAAPTLSGGTMTGAIYNQAGAVSNAATLSMSAQSVVAGRVNVSFTGTSITGMVPQAQAISATARM